MLTEVLIFAAWLVLTCIVTGIILNLVVGRYGYDVADRWENKLCAFIAASFIVTGLAQLLAFITGHLSGRL